MREMRCEKTVLEGKCVVRIAKANAVRLKFESRASGQVRFVAVAIAGGGKDPSVVEISLGRRVAM